MTEIEGLSLENVVSFDRLKVRLNKNALTFIRGVNLDSDPADPTGNGVGKSLLFSTIPNLFFFAPPLSIRKKSSKELLRKGSCVTVGLKNEDGTKYKITQTATSYTILENGVDLQLRTKPLAEKYIRDLFPLSDVEYYTHGFVSTQRPFPLQAASDSDRLELISTIFRLGNYGELRQFFATKLRSVKDNEIKLSVLEQTSNALSAKIEKASKNISTRSLGDARDTQERLTKNQKALEKREFQLLKNMELLKTLLTIEHELDELRSSYSFKDHPAKRLPWLKQQRRIAKAVEEHNSLMQAYEKSIKSIQSKIDGLVVPDLSREECEGKISVHTARRDKLQSTLNELSAKKKTYDHIVSDASDITVELEHDHGISTKTSDVDLGVDYDDQIASARTTLKLSSLLKHAHDGDDSIKCPTCMSDVDLANIKSAVSKAEKVLPKLLAKKKQQQLFSSLLELRKRISELDFKPGQMIGLRQAIEGQEKKISSLEENINTWKKIAYLKKSLKTIEKPAIDDSIGAPETDLSYDDLDMQVELCSNILKHLEAKDRLLENNEFLSECRTVKSVKSKIDETSGSLSEVTHDIHEINKAIAKCCEVLEEQTNLANEVALYREELKSTKSKIEKLKPSLDDKKILEVLIKAYGPKGLKTLAADQICSLLEDNLNYYRSLVFAEPFVFTARATETGLSIMVDRNNGKPHAVSDVRNLSGAESNCFRLLSVISLLPLVPSNRRLNMLVLDEPTAHCHVTTRNLIYDNYLPALMEVIPNIYVIDNQGDSTPKGAQEWILTKQGGISTLSTGVQ